MLKLIAEWPVFLGAAGVIASATLFIAQSTHDSLPSGVKDSRDELMVIAVTVGIIPAALGSLKSWMDHRTKKDETGWTRAAQMEARYADQITNDRNEAITIISKRDHQIETLHELLRLNDNRTVQLEAENKYQAEQIVDLKADIVDLKQEIERIKTQV